MAWFSGKVSLGNFPDLAGAVNKISESVKNIEKNFDSALGFEEKTDTDTSEASGLWPTTDTKALFEPMMAFMGNKGGESTVDSIEIPASLEPHPPSSVVEKEGAEIDKSSNFATKQTKPAEDINEESSPLHPASAEDSTSAAQVTNAAVLDHEKSDLEVPGNSGSDSQLTSIDSCNTGVEHPEEPDSITHVNQKETSAAETAENSELMEVKPVTNEADHVEDNGVVPPESHNITNLHATANEKKSEEGGTIENLSLVGAEDVVSGSQPGMGVDLPGSVSATSEETESPDGPLTNSYPTMQHGDGATQMGSEPVSHEHDTVVKAVDVSQQTSDFEPDTKESVSSGSTMSDITESVVEVEKLKMETKMMETALQGAARQAQAKADEISKLMNENENLKAVIEDLRRKSSESEIESLREEYHQRVAALERKVYALTKERDTLRREQSKKSDSAALLKEKDEIINQVMAEGEELSKKQAAQESHIRKLRAQIRELEEEKKGLSTKLQVEENKVESIKKDKAATEKLLQETVEKHQAELAAQKEFYTNALNAAKEAEALAEARANNEARTELESRLREAEERETMLVQTLEELRQTLSRKEQQAVFREDMLRRDIEDLQKRYQASERRCEELVTQLPESTRPLLRQIEAMQETTARRAEAWAAVERSLTSRLQEAEAKAAAAEERERSVNERLSQTLSRINVLEAQISCLRAEQTQLSRTLEKERQRAAENRQEYLAAKEEADTQEGRVSQLEEEIKELRRKYKQELQEALTHREFLQKEIEREKTARLELERNAHLQTSTVSDQSPLLKQKSGFENGKLNRKLSSASSLSSMEESFFLQASLDSSDTFSEHRNHGDMPISPYFVKSFTPSAFEATLRQKEGELASYISRLASLEKIRDSLAEELVQMTEQCEKLRVEAAVLPGIRAELEALRRRHSAALELMGERDEELEELRADIVDMKEMYREQVNLLVNKIQKLSSTFGSSTT